MTHITEIAIIDGETRHIRPSIVPPSVPVARARKPYIDEEYEAWKRENGLDRRLTHAEYVREFDPCGLGLNNL